MEMDIDVETPQNEDVQMDFLAEESSAKKRKQTTVTSTTLDLDSYIANYNGHPRTNRLVYIGEICPSLRIEALQMALKDLLDTLDTDRYAQVHQVLNEALGAQGMDLVPLDTQWIEQTRRSAVQTSARLEADLKNYKNSLIKESIRMGHADMGDHYYNMGDLASAIKCYTRTRDYCTTPKNVLDMCMSIIKCGLEQGNYALVTSYVMKAQATPDALEKDQVQTTLICVEGLLHLKSSKYRRAAKTFLTAEYSEKFKDIPFISPMDVARYTGLCALATFERTELKEQVIDSSDFKRFLELDPQVREIIHCFYSSKYVPCLEMMETIKNDLLLDLHLNEHVEALFARIRKNAILQYFSPYLTVDMHRMASAFNTSVQLLESELASLISENSLKARIDSHNKVHEMTQILQAKETNERNDAYKTALQLGESYQSHVKIMLLRAKLLKSDLVVRPQKSQ